MVLTIGTTAVIGLAIGLVTTFLAQKTELLGKKSDSRKKATNFGLWTAALTGLFLVLSMPMINIIPASFSDTAINQVFTAGLDGEDVDNGGTSDVDVFQVSGADSSVTFSGVNAYTQTAVGGTHRYKISSDGGKSYGVARTVTDANTATLSPGNKAQVLWNNGSLIGNNAYFSKVTEELVGQGGTDEFNAELYQNGTFTLTVFNEDNQKIAGSALTTAIGTGMYNISLSTGGTETVDASLKGTFQRAIPYGMIVVAEFNQTTMDEVIVNFQGIEMENVKTVNVPSAHTVTHLGWYTKAYEIPAMYGGSDIDGNIYVKADDNTQPGQDADHVLLTFYPKNYFVNEDTGGSFEGPAVQDEDDNLIGLQKYTFNLGVE